MKYYIFIVLAIWILERGHTQNSTYKFFKDTKTWYEARKTCIKEGGHLATVDSDEEERKITDYLKTQIGSVWVFSGFHMIFDGDIIDVFGNPLILKHWHPGQPDSNFRTEQCGSLYSTTTTLNDLNCDAAYTYLCEFENKQTTIPDPELFKTFYSVNKQAMSWPEARRTCRHKGGHLVILNDEEELNLVLKKAKKDNLDWFWVGYHNMLKDDEIILETGESPSSQILKWQVPCGREQKYGALHVTGEPKLECTYTKLPSVCEITIEL